MAQFVSNNPVGKHSVASALQVINTTALQRCLPSTVFHSAQSLKCGNAEAHSGGGGVCGDVKQKLTFKFKVYLRFAPFFQLDLSRFKCPETGCLVYPSRLYPSCPFGGPAPRKADTGVSD